MIQTITYCKDTDLLVAEIKDRFPDYEFDGQFCIDKGPVLKIGKESLSIIIIDDQRNPNLMEGIKSLDNLQCLGSYDDVFSDADKKAIYDRFYQREYEFVDDDGNTQTGLKPEKFAEFKI